MYFLNNFFSKQTPPINNINQYISILETVISDVYNCLFNSIASQNKNQKGNSSGSSEASSSKSMNEYCTLLLFHDGFIRFLTKSRK